MEIATFFTYLTALEHAEEWKTHLKTTGGVCSKYQDCKCEINELCITSLAQILKKKRSSVTRDINNIAQLLNENPDDPIIIIRKLDDEPITRPRVFVSLTLSPMDVGAILVERQNQILKKKHGITT